MATKHFTKEKLIEECKKLYDEHGVSIFLYKNFDKKLYMRLYSNGIKLSDIIRILNVEDEFTKYKNSLPYQYGSETRHRWTWNRILSEAKKVVKKQNFLPPAAWFQENGHASLIQAVYNLGKSWEDLRNEFNSYENSAFVISRNGIRWRSHPGASLSNFLYVRGIKHTRGRKYPEDYAEQTGQNYGYYDLHFKDKNNNSIDVEIWGEKPNGHAQRHYEYKKNLKEQYNSTNKNFLGINFRNCYSETQLEKILESYIGIVTPFIFETSYDDIIPSTHWSNADELIEYCKEFAKKMPNGIFPTEEWLRKRGKWKRREGEAYNTLSIYIKKWIGGIRQLRKIIGQKENSTIKWSKEKAIKEYKAVYKQYGITPGQIRGKVRSEQMIIDDDEMKRINNIDYAVRKHCGSCYEVNELLGIKNYRKRSI